MRIPNSVIYVVGDVLASWYYSKSTLDTLFGRCGFPGDPPVGNCVHKCQEWMRRANEAPDLDPLELLGCALVEFSNLDLQDDPRWQEGFRRVTEVMAKNGLEFDLNGNISPSHSGIAIKPYSSLPKASQVVSPNPPPLQIPTPLPLSIAAPLMKSTVLFLASNPDGVTKLALDKECRAIRDKLRASEFPKAIELKTEWAVRADDLLQYFNEYRPYVVHFSGHGSAAEELILHDEFDQAKPVSIAALRAVFTSLKDNIRLVVLNACYSRPQAEAIVEIVDCAVGMNRAIGDRAAIVFAASFYRALGFGRSVKEAFDQGCTALMLEGIPEENTPELLVKNGINASKVFLAGPDVNPK